MYEALLDFVLRAPLLPERELGRGRAALEGHALGPLAIALASRGLAAAKASAARGRALERYGRRATFRATPQGLLAGVCVGTLARTTRIATGRPGPWLAPTWGRMDALARALLDDPSLRPLIALRAAPSLVRGATTARWLAPGDPFGEARVAELDAPLAAILDAATAWASWKDVRRAAESAAPETDVLERDDLLLLLVDDGLLQTDLTPPLVGAPPDVWMRARLARLERVPFAETLERADAALARGDLAGGSAALASLPGGIPAGGADVHGVLVHRPRTTPTLARTAVARAAGLVPLLFRLQDALVPPASERLAQPAVGEALDAVTEAQGDGAFDLAALEAGDYGVTLHEDEANGGDDAAVVATPPSVLTTLVDAIVEAARARRTEATLDATKLTAAFAAVGPAPPATCELFLAPSRRPRGAREGTGWLLGLHAPAGASWGRFAAALGAPLARALTALATAEREARPLEETLDVSYAPSPALADLCTHPPIRRRALALSTWSALEGVDDHAAADLTLADLELVATPGASTPLALRERAGETPVVPSPLARVRSSTAPAGAMRLVCGWSLTRQHAPWALALGPLAALEHVPRLVLDGFVVAPASFRLPAGRPTRARLARWRRDAGVPRWIQVGHEDQLLPVDLDSPSAARDVAGHERAWEIWPPPGATVDRDGRRVEAIVALVDRPDADEAAEHARGARATAGAGRAPPPRREPPPAAWTTYKIFGAPEHAESLLLDAVLPTIAAARATPGELTQWFFLRYIDGPGPRHHLRVRVQASTPDGQAAFAARLAGALAPARAAGAVVTVETADYHPERARFGAALASAHEIFESDSETACALLAEEDAPDGDAPDRLTQVVRSLDALARGLGLDLGARRALARARRDAHVEADAAGERDAELRAAGDAEFRARARQLRAHLGTPGAGAAARALRAHERRTARATRALPAEARAALAPALLHLACVRLAGADRDLEARAYTFWERTLEGLWRAPPSAPSSAAVGRGFRRTRRQAT